MMFDRTQDVVISRWGGTKGVPVLTVCCITYNHANYLADALDGILKQETNFPFEIIIHDDASTDGTQEIISQYQLAYPQIIKSVIQPINQYSLGARPMQTLMPMCRGKYVAVCEGDDYWVDPKKLQTQVDFLEKNPDFVISGHDAVVIDDQGELLKSSKLPDSQKRDFSAQELQKCKAWLLTMSWVYRNVFSEYPHERTMVKNGDKFFTSMLGHYGKSHYHPEIIPAVYRAHARGIWSSLSTQEKLDSHSLTYYWMYRYYSRVGNDGLALYFWGRLVRVVLDRTPLSLLLSEFAIRVLFVRKLKQRLSHIFTSLHIHRNK